jgi:hypothetical protein
MADGSDVSGHTIDHELLGDTQEIPQLLHDKSQLATLSNFSKG